MGWQGGHDIAEDMIKSINMWVDSPMLREGIYEDLIRSLRSHDWDDGDFFSEDREFQEAMCCLEEEDNEQNDN